MLLSVHRTKIFPFIRITRIEEPEVDYLHELYYTAEVACEAALSYDLKPMGPLLCCLEARLLTTNFGDKDYEIVIETTDPNDSLLRAFLGKFMAQRGYKVEVIMV